MDQNFGQENESKPRRIVSTPNTNSTSTTRPSKQEGSSILVDPLVLECFKCQSLYSISWKKCKYEKAVEEDVPIDNDPSLNEEDSMVN